MLTLIRGAGDIASGAAMRLWRSGIDVVMTDLPVPTAIRRTVAFAGAITYGEAMVEDVRAVRAETAAQAKALLRRGVIPVLPDPECHCRAALAPDALVQTYIDIAGAVVREERWHALWREGMRLFVAHFLTLYMRDEPESDGRAALLAAAWRAKRWAR